MPRDTLRELSRPTQSPRYLLAQFVVLGLFRGIFIDLRFESPASPVMSHLLIGTYTYCLDLRDRTAIRL